MDSRIAGVIQYIQDQMFTDPVLGGVGPNPVPIKAVYPYVTVQEINAQEMFSHDGRTNEVPATIQVNSYSTDYEQAHLMRELIKDSLLNGTSGPLGTRAIDGPPTHIIDTELFDSNRELHQLISRFSIWFV